MSEQLMGLYFSCNADKSAHDYTIYVEGISASTVKIGARYKNSERNSLYEIEMDADDLQRFGDLCTFLSKQIRNEEAQG